ncbi:hypothetical protein DTO013E5_5510 [Penicillium roqueforti]|uniref:uncharacterized protein n=1 Tax=Penicillium roqueforti TaxID=5082 RepID=UPI00190E553D|nr:uncharacterized protein LCP9604111_3363 [Penicillium roqueforti]KAF9250461.1 hypothetical protein LCP9604111_3363 [Penicillium roqueforti]KAI1833151.1 hypothetical protein CBS147337_6108 [Penicillium roqueforti]KAI2672754.1 hypothetical protein CBS147355_8081 [Penicillium roqueforti]KAI2698802.1 hypothetical protein CBS147372_6649 [Penicillium roqueforti]KAI2716396.1 hypothetical protein CBS147318_5510 [Penicillium roqueforti]
MLFSFLRLCFVLLTAWTTWAAADFALYKNYDADALIAGLSLSSTCLAALNTTVSCNETAISLLGHGADIHFWTTAEVENLCTTDCVSSLSFWKDNVATVCAEETTIQGNVVVKARALPLTFTYNSDLVCMKDSSSNWCFLVSQTWQGSDYIRWDPTMCFADGDDNSTVAPECADPDFDVGDISDDMSALTNIYEEKLFCNECFLNLYRQRLLNPWLPVTNFTDYLVDQFNLVQTNCSTTLPYSTSASTLYVGTATATTTTSVTTTGSSATTTPTCLGQMVQPLQNWLTCNDLCDTYNISTGDARVATGDYACYFDEATCFPRPCEIDTVWDTPSCDGLATRYSNSTYTVTTAQLLSWNTNIQGSCSGIAAGQRVCKSAPGGTFPKPNATITAPGATGEPTYYTAATAAYPTQSGTISECGNYYLVVAGDDCSTIDLRFGLNFSQLQEYNPYLNSTCGNLWLNYDICVAPVTPETVSTDAQATAPRRKTAPVDLIMGARLVFPSSETAVVYTATAAMVPPIVVQGTAILAVVTLIMAARPQMENVARILPETRPALVPSLGRAVPRLVIVEVPVTTVLGQTAIAVLVRRDVAQSIKEEFLSVYTISK